MKPNQRFYLYLIGSIMLIGLTSLIIFPGFCELKAQGLSPKILAYIDSQRVVDESKTGLAALKELEEFKKNNEEELGKKVKEITELEDELRKKKMVLSSEASGKIEEDIRKKNIELKRFKEDKELELKDLYFKHLNQIKIEIVQVIETIGKENGYTFILNKDDSIIYANPTNDITDLVIKAYDKIAETKSSKSK